MPLSVILEEVPVLGSIATYTPDIIKTALHTIEIRKLWAYLILNMVTQ